MKKILSSNSQFKILLLASFITLVACDDIFEEDLSKDVFIVVTPPANYDSNSSTINFFWEELEDATDYKLQIARPDFNQPIQIVLDSSYNSSSASVNLSPGTYEWRMRAENANSFTTYVYGNLRVDSTSSLENIVPVLSSPNNEIYTNKDSLLFSWEELENASEYRLETVDQNTGLTHQVLISQTNQVYVSNFLETTYQWSIQGLNDFSISASAARTFFIDRTPAPAVTLLQPENDIQFSQGERTFRWQIPADVGNIQSPRSYEIQISNNESFNGYNFGTPTEMNSDSSVIDLNLAGAYFWRIQSLDEAGNDSIFSTVRTFSVAE